MLIDKQCGDKELLHCGLEKVKAVEKTIGATARSGALGLLSGAEALAQALFEKKGEAKGDDEE